MLGSQLVNNTRLECIFSSIRDLLTSEYKYENSPMDRQWAKRSRQASIVRFACIIPLALTATKLTRSRAHAGFPLQAPEPRVFGGRLLPRLAKAKHVKVLGVLCTPSNL